MISNQHQMPRAKVRVDGAGGVGDNQAPNSQQGHDLNRKNDVLHGIAFIIVKPAGHHQEGMVALPSRKENPFVIRGCRSDEAGDVPVWNLNGILQGIGVGSKSAAQNDSRIRQISGTLFSDILCRLFQLFQSLHRLHLLIFFQLLDVTTIPHVFQSEEKVFEKGEKNKKESIPAENVL